MDSTAPSGTEVVYVTWLRGEPERVCACGFHVSEGDEDDHEGCE